MRQGQVEAAIAEYGALVAEQPRDLSSANALGDLLVRAGRTPEALPLYLHVADSYQREGFFSKAAGFYKKVLKFTPDDEAVTLRLADALALQGLTVEARAQLTAVRDLRRRRGDGAGADQVLLRLADLDPRDIASRVDAARMLVRSGDPSGLERLAGLVGDLREAGSGAAATSLLLEWADHMIAANRADLAAAGLRDHLSLVPDDLQAAERLVNLYEHSGAEADADALASAQRGLADACLRLGHLDRAREVFEDLVLDDPDDPGHRAGLVAVLTRLGDVDPFATVERLLDLAEVDEDDPLLPPVTAGPAGGGAAPPARASDEVDLTDALERLAASEDADPGGTPSAAPLPERPETLDDVFERLRQEASPRRGTEGRQQVALGRTYLAAGLVEAAIEAFGRAALDPDARAVAAVALAEAYEELEDGPTSLEWLERGADAAESPEAERADAMRRLAEALEGRAEPERALAVWLELATLCPGDARAASAVVRLSADSRRP